jgi:hypothetical protein
VVIEPSRLRDQVLPSSSSVATGATPDPAVRDGRAKSQWRRRRAITTAAFTDVALLAAAAIVSTASPPFDGWGIGLVVVGLVALGALVSFRSGGIRSVWWLLSGIAVGSLVAGLGGIAVLAHGTVSEGSLFLALAYAVLLVIFQAIPAAVGSAVGAALRSVIAERRHRAVARGDRQLLRPVATLVRRSDSGKPLDAVSAARLVEDGAATQVVRIYHRQDPGPILAADAAILAGLGYALTSVTRKAPWPTILAVPLRAILFAVTLLLLVTHAEVVAAFGKLVSDARHGRCTATFDLQSPDHRPVPVRMP